jgi:predicted nuclease of restriction endonuclease-like (RecB) superfamily
MSNSLSNTTTDTIEGSFVEVAQLITAARQKAVQAVNTQLIELCWQVGAYISHKIEKAEWGEGVVPQLADYLAQTQPALSGFTRRNLFRMRQFYEAYRSDAIVSALLTQLPWTQNLIILSQSKRPEEREFYLRMAIQEKWSKRELERQFKAALFERTVTQPAKVSAVLRQSHPTALSIFKDAYMVEFLDLPRGHADADLHSGLVQRLKDFLSELGRAEHSHEQTSVELSRAPDSGPANFMCGSEIIAKSVLPRVNDQSLNNSPCVDTQSPYTSAPVFLLTNKRQPNKMPAARARKAITRFAGSFLISSDQSAKCPRYSFDSSSYFDKSASTKLCRLR